VSLQGGDPSNVALGMALVGGCAYLVGFVQGEGEGKGEREAEAECEGQEGGVLQSKTDGAGGER
jgi:hypothetical protein